MAITFGSILLQTLREINEFRGDIIGFRWCKPGSGYVCEIVMVHGRRVVVVHRFTSASDCRFYLLGILRGRRLEVAA